MIMGADQSNDYYIPVPAESENAWHALRRAKHTPINPGLVFDRFAPAWYGKKEDHANEAKYKGLLEVVKATRRTDPKLFGAFVARYTAGTDAANAKRFRLKTDWRLVAGLGRKGPLEVGFTFNRYGYPVLPGSTLKGVARAWGLALLTDSSALAPDGWEQVIMEPKDKTFESRLGKTGAAPHICQMARQLRWIFGTQDQAGGVVFWDGIPAEIPTLEVDIMNPHYPKYYQEKEPPTNWQSPVPIFFLTVAAGMSFFFAVSLRPGFALPDGSTTTTSGLLELSQDWLKNGLMELGAGAKTNAGYGYFA